METSQTATERQQARKQRAWSLFVLGGLALLFSRVFLGDGTPGNETHMGGFVIALLIGLSLIVWGVMMLDKNKRERG